ncbi:MAG: DUF429 domain-containing protein [Thermoproteota archaeon]|nr:MAG: DUF429 domain-containing protein [Candidatus Korarchaeota archaeon]RLG55699.1 MAG: DUF429 domain-containing protein [Candidatus Korarchaeota archaeon]
MKAAGIDLTGSESKATSIAIVSGGKIRLYRATADHEIIEVVSREKPDVIAIDAPLTKPHEGYLRKLERKAAKEGIKLLPPMLRGMRKLTERGVRLRRALEERGFNVIEVHPTSSRKILGISGSLEEAWKNALGIAKVSTSPDIKPSRDDLDALLAAITGIYYLKGKYRSIKGEGELILPSP